MATKSTSQVIKDTKVGATAPKVAAAMPQAQVKALPTFGVSTAVKPSISVTAPVKKPSTAPVAQVAPAVSPIVGDANKVDYSKVGVIVNAPTMKDSWNKEAKAAWTAAHPTAVAPTAPVTPPVPADVPTTPEGTQTQIDSGNTKLVADKKAYDDVVEANKNAYIEDAEAVKAASVAKYDAEQNALTNLQEVQAKALADRNAALQAGSDVQRADAELSYKKSTDALEIQRQRTQKAYQDQILDQKEANTKRVLEEESATAALGGFGSLTAFKRIQDLTLKNDRQINDLVFNKDISDQDITNKIVNTTQQYKNDLFLIETNKQKAISENYDKYLQYVTQIQNDREMSEVEKFNSIKSAQAEYTKNIASLNQASFETKYKLSQDAAKEAREIKAAAQEQIESDRNYQIKLIEQGAVDDAISSKIGYLVDKFGKPILDANGDKIKTLPKVELVKDPIFGTVLGYFDPNTNKFVPMDGSGSQGGQESTDYSVDVVDKWLGLGINQSYGNPVTYESNGKHNGVDFTLPGGNDAVVETPVSGTVTSAGLDGNYGNSVIITDTKGNEHRVSHLSSVGVKKGDLITAGQSVGKQGSTGRSTGTHVDYRIKNSGGEYVDPIEFLNNLKSSPGGGTQRGLTMGNDPGFQQYLADAAISDPSILYDAKKKAEAYKNYKLGVTAPEADSNTELEVKSYKDLIQSGSLKLDAIPASQFKLRNLVAIALAKDGNSSDGKSTVTPLGKEALALAQTLKKVFDKNQGGFAVGTSNIFGIQHLPGTESGDFANDVRSLKSKLSLEAVKYLKGQGAISEGERALLSESVTNLSLNQTEEKFGIALQGIIDKLSGASSTSEATSSSKSLDRNNPWIKKIDEMSTVKNIDIKEEDIKDLLDKGQTPEQIYKSLFE